MYLLSHTPILFKVRRCYSVILQCAFNGRFTNSTSDNYFMTLFTVKVLVIFFKDTAYNKQARKSLPFYVAPFQIQQLTLSVAWQVLKGFPPFGISLPESRAFYIQHCCKMSHSPVLKGGHSFPSKREIKLELTLIWWNAVISKCLPSLLFPPQAYTRSQVSFLFFFKQNTAQPLNSSTACDPNSLSLMQRNKPDG